MKTIGFIGLGTMGLPMAANLLKKGFGVFVWNRTASKADQLVPLGARKAESPAHAAREADVVVTMLSDDATVLDVYEGEDGVLAGLRAGTAVFDSSTVSPDTSRRLHAACRERGASFIDAPVTGSKPAAESGTLLFMAGGDRSVLEAHEDVLLAMGRRIVYMGESGAGSYAKLAHNTIVGINAIGLIEGMSIAAKAGIDARSFLEVVQSGGAASKQADLKGLKIIERDFSNQFSGKLMLKDLRLAVQLIGELGVTAPMLDLARAQFERGVQAGWGDEDLCALVRWYEDQMDMVIGEDRR